LKTFTKLPDCKNAKVSEQFVCSKKIWLLQGSGWRGWKFGRCLALEWKTWSHWKPGGAMAKS
jgi:hypothetical protein